MHRRQPAQSNREPGRSEAGVRIVVREADKFGPEPGKSEEAEYIVEPPGADKSGAVTSTEELLEPDKLEQLTRALGKL